MDRWQGSLPLASASLVSTFEKAAKRGVQFSLAERALFLACEFWSAISARRVIEHLGAGSIDALRYLSIIYSAIGAHGVVRAMAVAIEELEGASLPQTRYQYLTSLQLRLLTTPDPVDELIARFAQNLGLASGASSSSFRDYPDLRMGT
jgi:hypothetical protein